MKNTCLIISLLALSLTFDIAPAEDGKGGQPGAFRQMNLGGRPAALGGAFTAIAEGGSGHLYNPAGAASQRHYGFNFSYRVMDLDRRLGYAAVSIPARDNANLSLSWIYAGTSDLDPRDEQGNIIDGEPISYNENLLGFTFAKQFTTFFYFGGKLFYAQNNIANISAYTAGADFGALFKADMRKTFLKPYFPLLQAGIAIENLGAAYKWSTQDYWQTRGRELGATVDEDFPTNFRFGLALMQPYKYLISSDFEVNSASQTKTHFGAEYTYRKVLALRAGLDDTHPTFGIGVLKRFEKFALWVDLSYLTDRVGEGDDFLASFDITF